MNADELYRMRQLEEKVQNLEAKFEQGFEALRALYIASTELLNEVNCLKQQQVPTQDSSNQPNEESKS